MKAQQPVKLRLLTRLRENAIGRQPILIRSYIEQQHSHESGEVEDLLFNRQPSTGNRHSASERRGNDL
jgi:hypothetical protein